MHQRQIWPQPHENQEAEVIERVICTTGMNDRAVSVSCVNALLASLTFGLYHTLHPKPSRLRGTIKDVAELIKLSVTEHVATRPLCGGHRLLYQSSNVTKQPAVKSKREKKRQDKSNPSEQGGSFKATTVQPPGEVLCWCKLSRLYQTWLFAAIALSHCVWGRRLVCFLLQQW